MGLKDRLGLRRRRGGDDGGSPRAASRAAAEEARTHLRDFVATRRGVEAYVEPATSVTQVTIMLVADDGEWTRRRVRDGAAAGDVARDLGIPVYDVNRTGYPARVRAWNARRRERDLGI